jgi:hypothetical protein
VHLRVESYVLVLSATVLVLVIESRLKWSNVRSAHDLPMTETQLVPFSERDSERKHKHESGALRARARNRKQPEAVECSFNTRPASDGSKASPVIRAR